MARLLERERERGDDCHRRRGRGGGILADRVRKRKEALRVAKRTYMKGPILASLYTKY